MPVCLNVRDAERCGLLSVLSERHRKTGAAGEFYGNRAQRGGRFGRLQIVGLTFFPFFNFIEILEGILGFERKDVFDISQRLQDMTKETPIQTILDGIQNYMLQLLKSNPRETELIKHIEFVEDAKKQAKLGMRPINVFDDLCLKLIK